MVLVALHAKTEECVALAPLSGLNQHPIVFNIIRLRDNFMEYEPDNTQVDSTMIELKNSLPSLLFDKDEKKIFFYLKAMDALALAEVLYFYKFR